MGFRFRKSVRILPGVRWNISKRGSSFSFGGKGLTVNTSKKGTRTTVGLPGTGLSYSTYKPRNASAAQANQTGGVWVLLVVAVLLIAVIAAA